MTRNVGICFLGLICLTLAGCATTHYKGSRRAASIRDYVELESFCKKHNFSYSFDTIDDIIHLSSESKEIKLLLNSSVAVQNGSFLQLKNPPLYHKGKILLPPHLDKFIAKGAVVFFKPAFQLKNIVIDPGHGGKDPGAISRRGLQEKKINLIIAGCLKQELERQGFKVTMTRSKDVYLTLAERTNIAKRHNADLFISIHTNSNHSSSVHGAEIYYLSPSRLNSRERAVRLAKSGSFYGKELGLDTKTILWDLLITKNHALSVEISDILQFTFKSLGLKIAPPKQAPFYVLRFAYVPSVLVEVGYLSNSYEEKALRKKHYQKQLAQAIALGVSSLNKRYSETAKK